VVAVAAYCERSAKREARSAKREAAGHYIIHKHFPQYFQKYAEKQRIAQKCMIENNHYTIKIR